MKLPLYWIDAFAARVFAGNPAAVVPLDAWLDDALMQRIAFENGLAETAFFVPAKPPSVASAKEGRFHLRWFTPAVEVDLCGHATLASAHVLLNELGPRGDVVTFDTRSGPLTVTRRTDGKLELDFPATPVTGEKSPPSSPPFRPRSAGCRRGSAIRNSICSPCCPTPAPCARCGPTSRRSPPPGGRGLIVTAPGDGAGDFVLRFFAPQSGIAEDPVTGSAHCTLAPSWAARLGKDSLHARQVSARGGELWCELAGGRVKIAGRATPYLRGEITL